MSGDEDLAGQGLARFIIMPAGETFDGQERVLPRTAYDLQVRATSHSAVRGHAGFVPDEYLAGLGTETTITAADLCTAGMWERTDGGYRVLDTEAVNVCLDQIRETRGRGTAPAAAPRA